MHRSGTSALGALLAAAAVNGGSEEHMMLPNFANPAGYAELQPMADFNDEVLTEYGWFWDGPPANPPAHQPVRSDLVDKGRALVDRYLKPRPRFVKDPRFSVLMPLWRRILGDRLVVVVTVRPALEVAWSLAIRDGFPISLGLALWSAYYRHLAAGVSGMDTVFVDYPSLVMKPMETTGEVLRALSELQFEFTVPIETVAQAVRPELRRTSVPAEIMKSYEPPTIEDLVPGSPDRRVSVVRRDSASRRAPPAPGRRTSSKSTRLLAMRPGVEKQNLRSCWSSAGWPSGSATHW